MSAWAGHREVAEAAARAAGRLLAENAGRSVRAEHKGAVDLVTEMDKAAEALIVERLRAAYPDAAVLAEEGGATAGSGAGGSWIVDPLDGTTNYAHGHPQWCVSIAYEQGGRVRAAVIFDALRDETFTAAEGEGALLNGRPMRVSTVDSLDASLLATGFPYDRRERADFYMAYYRAAVVATQGVRRAGAAALDMAWVAAGRLDGYFELGIQAWDVAAGELLVREAGGAVSAYDGGPHRLSGRNTVATNGRIHAELVRMLGGVKGG